MQQHDVADKQVTEAVAGLDAARSNLTEAQLEYKRTNSLVKRKLASDQDLDTAKNKLANAQASLEQARATVEKAIANRGEEGAEAAVVQQAAATAQAELNLSYTDMLLLSMVSPVKSTICRLYCRHWPNSVRCDCENAIGYAQTLKKLT